MKWKWMDYIYESGGWLERLSRISFFLTYRQISRPKGLLFLLSLLGVGVGAGKVGRRRIQVCACVDTSLGPPKPTTLGILCCFFLLNPLCVRHVLHGNPSFVVIIKFLILLFIISRYCCCCRILSLSLWQCACVCFCMLYKLFSILKA